jgi:hypothetical protein
MRSYIALAEAGCCSLGRSSRPRTHRRRTGRNDAGADLQNANKRPTSSLLKWGAALVGRRRCQACVEREQRRWPLWQRRSSTRRTWLMAGLLLRLVNQISGLWFCVLNDLVNNSCLGDARQNAPSAPQALVELAGCREETESHSERWREPAAAPNTSRQSRTCGRSSKICRPDSF